MARVDPFSAIDKFLLHPGDVCGRSAEGGEPKTCEIFGEFAQVTAPRMGRGSWIGDLDDLSRQARENCRVAIASGQVGSIMDEMQVCVFALGGSEYKTELDAVFPAGSNRSPRWEIKRFAVAKSIVEWMQEGEQLYAAALRSYQQLEHELADLEKKLATKQDEVNQIAQIIGKPVVEGNRRLTAQLIDDHGPNTVPNSHATIARALAGRNLSP